MVSLVAPRIGNDVSYVTRITHAMHFAWRAQYLVKLQGDFSWQAQNFVTFWEIAGPQNIVFFIQNAARRWEESGLRSGGCEMASNCLEIGGSNSGISRSNLELRIWWQALYLVSLKGDIACSAHCK